MFNINSNRNKLDIFFGQTRVSQALAQTNPSARVTKPPQASFCRREEGRTPNLVSDESMSTAPPGPLGWNKLDI